MMKHNKWLPEELDILRQIFKTATVAELRAALPRHPPNSSYKKGHDLGLRRDTLQSKQIKAYRRHQYPFVIEMRRLRKEQGHTLESLSKVVGCCAGDIQKWEAGRQKPRLDNLLAWVEALGQELKVIPAGSDQIGGAPQAWMPHV